MKSSQVVSVGSLFVRINLKVCHFPSVRELYFLDSTDRFWHFYVLCFLVLFDKVGDKTILFRLRFVQITARSIHGPFGGIVAGALRYPGSPLILHLTLQHLRACLLDLGVQGPRICGAA